MSFKGVLAEGHLSPELLTNPDFTGSATGWTLGANWAYGSDAVTHTPGSVATLSQAPAVQANTLYRVSASQTLSAGYIVITVGGVQFTETADGANDDVTGLAYTTDTTGVIITPSSDYDGTITSVTLTAITPALSIQHPDLTPADGLRFHQDEEGVVNIFFAGVKLFAFVPFAGSFITLRNAEFNLIGRQFNAGYVNNGATAVSGFQMGPDEEVGSTAGVPENWSPAVAWIGSAWDTDDSVSRDLGFTSFVKTFSAAVPYGELVWTLLGDPATLMALNAAGDLRMTGTITPAGGYKAADTSAGITQDVTTASLVGKTMTFKNGLLTGFA